MNTTALLPPLTALPIGPAHRLPNPTVQVTVLLDSAGAVHFAAPCFDEELDLDRDHVHYLGEAIQDLAKAGETVLPFVFEVDRTFVTGDDNEALAAYVKANLPALIEKATRK